MLGRGALASPLLAREAARELGIPGAARTGSFGRTPAEWLPLVQRFVVIAGAMGESALYAASRIKQWLRLANHDGCMSWFEALKRRQGLHELLDHLGALAAPPASGPSGEGGYSVSCGVSRPGFIEREPEEIA
jgi:hypothetical protein